MVTRDIVRSGRIVVDRVADASKVHIIRGTLSDNGRESISRVATVMSRSDPFSDETELR